MKVEDIIKEIDKLESWKTNQPPWEQLALQVEIERLKLKEVER